VRPRHDLAAEDLRRRTAPAATLVAPAEERAPERDADAGRGRRERRAEADRGALEEAAARSVERRTARGAHRDEREDARRHDERQREHETRAREADVRQEQPADPLEHRAARERRRVETDERLVEIGAGDPEAGGRGDGEAREPCESGSRHGAASRCERARTASIRR